MADPAIADGDLHLVAGEWAGIELEWFKRFSGGPDGQGFDGRSHSLTSCITASG